MDESTVQFDEAELQRCQPVEVVLADGFTQVPPWFSRVSRIQLVFPQLGGPVINQIC
ncbi:hypothetical protein N8506_03250 [Synechococcus sp. AH-601-N23]|nr:hypothetical protein [Synechococcus sp. AH-601-N23]MDA7622272.1 hypothetical protein [bacterium]